MATDPGAISLIMDLRRQGVSDARVLSALERVPRPLFVDEGCAGDAWSDAALPIGCGQTISQPYVVARMTEALDVGDRDRVLEIGTGSGYQTAVLAQLARWVYTIERHRPLLKQAEARFAALGLRNVSTRHGDGTLGWPDAAPFDRILVTAAAAEPPAALLAQLKVGGVLVGPFGAETDRQSLRRIIHTKSGFEAAEILPVRFVPLTGGLPGET